MLVLSNYMIKNFFHFRTTDGYIGSGEEFVVAFNEIRSSIVEKYGPDEPIDWLIIHNAGQNLCTLS